LPSGISGAQSAPRNSGYFTISAREIHQVTKRSWKLFS
jgi:hypothetical protein